MAQQFESGQNAYLGMVAKAASSFVDGENRSKPKKDKDKGFVSQLEGQAISAIGAKLLSGDSLNSTNNPRNVGHLVSKLSSWNQDKRENSYLAKNRGIGYDERSSNMNGGYSYDDSRRSGYGGGSGWSGAPPSANRGYGYDQSQGYGGDSEWNPSGTTGGSGWDWSGDSLVLGRQGYYDNGGYQGYGNRRRTSDGYDGSYGNPPMSRGVYGYP